MTGWLWEQGLVVLLVACRVAPVVILAPYFGGRGLSMAVRAGVLVALVAILAPLAAVGAEAAPSWSSGLWIGLALKELSMGAAVAAVASVVFWGAEAAGALSDVARGAPSGPVEGLGSSSTPLGALGRWLSAAVFLAAGGHLIAIEALATSLVSSPVLAWPAWGEGARLEALEVFAALTGEIFALALLLSLPVLASVWIAALLIGVGQRALDARAIFAGMSARSLVGALAALAALRAVVALVVDGALDAFGALDGLLP